MGKMKTLVATFVLSASLFALPFSSALAAPTGPSITQPPTEEPTETTTTTTAPVTPEESVLMNLTANEEPGVESTVTVEEYNEQTGQLESTTTFKDGTMNTVDLNYNPYSGPDYIAIGEAELGYTLIDTFLGDSSRIDTLTEWVQQFGAAVIPALITKNVWGAGAGSATYNTFVKPPTTKYYKTWVYQARDSYSYYGKEVAKQYSDSARTKLLKTQSWTIKTPRAY